MNARRILLFLMPLALLISLALNQPHGYAQAAPLSPHAARPSTLSSVAHRHLSTSSLTALQTFISQAQLTGSDEVAGSEFGSSAAISNDGSTLVVGAPASNVSGAKGAAYVFAKPSGNWTTGVETAKLTASDGAAGDRFGNSVAISSDGSTIVVGAPLNGAAGGGTPKGAAYVFVRSGSTWTLAAKLTSSDTVLMMNLGYSVAISSDGSTVVAGSYATVIGSNPPQGFAYVFVKSGATWANMTSQTAKLTPSDAASNDTFGWAVAISGTTIVVGDTTSGGLLHPGAAYVFSQSGSNWAQAAKLTPLDSRAGDAFGAAVAISNDGSTIAGGAPAPLSAGSGAAYVFLKPSGGWTNNNQNAKLTPSDGGGGDEFGTAVAVSTDGGTIIVGSVNGSQNGEAYEFARPGTGWKDTLETAHQLYPHGASSFGQSVAISGDRKTAFVGAGTNSGGAVYVYELATGYPLYLPLLLK